MSVTGGSPPWLRRCNSSTKDIKQVLARWMRGPWIVAETVLAIGRMLPSALIASLPKIVCYAWCTTRRLRDDSVDCRMRVARRSRAAKSIAGCVRLFGGGRSAGLGSWSRRQRPIRTSTLESLLDAVNLLFAVDAAWVADDAMRHGSTLSGRSFADADARFKDLRRRRRVIQGSALGDADAHACAGL